MTVFFFYSFFFFSFFSKRIGLHIQNVKKNIAFTILWLIYIQKTAWLLGAYKAQKSDIQKFCKRIFLSLRSTEHPALPYRSAGLGGAQHLFWFGIQLGSSVEASFEIELCYKMLKPLPMC